MYPACIPVNWLSTEWWLGVHLDFARPIRGKTIPIAVDSHSKRSEAIPMSSATGEATISVLRETRVTKN